MFLSGTFLVNSIVDLLIHAMIINKKTDECIVHDGKDYKDGHEFCSERWWRRNIFPLVKEDKVCQEVFDRGTDIYLEFIEEFFISFDEDYINMVLQLPKRTIIPHEIQFIPNSPQQKAYYWVAHTFRMLHDMSSKDGIDIQSIRVIRSQIVVCIQFLTMLCLHPACIKVV